MSAYNVGAPGLTPGLGRSPGGGHGNPLQHSCLENPHGQRGLADYSPWGHKESDTTEPRSPGIRSACLGPANLASILKIIHNWKISWMGSGKTIVFLVCQKFPSHPSHFSLIFHNLVQVPVLVGLLDFPSPANTGSSWKLYSQTSPGVVFVLHLWVLEGPTFQKKAFSGSPGASAQGTLGASVPLECCWGSSWS